jgi:hypothetical protein
MNGDDGRQAAVCSGSQRAEGQWGDHGKVHVYGVEAARLQQFSQFRVTGAVECPPGLAPVADPVNVRIVGELGRGLAGRGTCHYVHLVPGQPLLLRQVVNVVLDSSHGRQVAVSDVGDAHD